jgi:hypothetical protein
MKKIIFIGNARDYHAMDWYRSVRDICKEREVLFITDLISSEGHDKLVKEDDSIIELYNIDKILMPNQSFLGNIWRNFIKLCFIPFQVYKLKILARSYPNAVFHAHTMYYLFISWGAGIKYIGTPQGSEILIRPYKSIIYKFFAIKSLFKADKIIVDSENMRQGIFKLSGRDATIIQYGIDVSRILYLRQSTKRIHEVVSIRGMYPLYRIDEIFKARLNMVKKPIVMLFYPFWEDGYRFLISKKLEANDIDRGRIPVKDDMYQILAHTLLAVSIPESDSSPRSVYEAIFCGCCVAVTYNKWIDALPICMKSRLFVADLDDTLWLEKALVYAKEVTKISYEPSEEALDMFDQRRSMAKVVDLFY